MTKEELLSKLKELQENLKHDDNFETEQNRVKEN